MYAIKVNKKLFLQRKGLIRTVFEIKSSKQLGKTKYIRLPNAHIYRFITEDISEGSMLIDIYEEYRLPYFTEQMGEDCIWNSFTKSKKL